MEQYLRQNRLSEVLDGIGIRMALYALALLWFVWLWGLGAPALLAAFGLGTLLQLLRSKIRRRSVLRREKALRRRLGAELHLEDMLLSGAREAHHAALQLLMQKHPMTLHHLDDAGALCRQGTDTLLIQCVRLPPEGETSLGDILACARAVRQCGADRGLLCTLGRTSAKTAAKAEFAPVPVRIIRREQLLTLAGAAHPATDEQLVALGKRRRSHLNRDALLHLIFRPDKARRYFTYGLLMLGLYILTGVRLYAVAGMTCLAMGSFAHARQPEDVWW